MSRKSTLLSQFEPDVVPALIDYGKHISRIDADAIIFMARKSLCLYDLLQEIGSPPTERTILTDRVLGMNCEALRGRHVALVDDTLIVGTTLAKVAHVLSARLDCTVTTHVFCIDSDWWAPDLVSPDYDAIRMPDARVMTFCASEVRALSIAPRPYLVEFPMSLPIHLDNSAAERLPVLLGWVAYDVSTALQAKHRVATLSFFPGEELYGRVETLIGTDLMECLNITKVRCFIRHSLGGYSLQVVPIVTTKALTVKTVTLAIQRLVDVLSDPAATTIKELSSSASTAAAKQRLLQYTLSLIVGGQFFSSLNQNGLAKGAQFDPKVARQNFGPWASSSLSSLHARRIRAVRRSAPLQKRPTLQPAELPKDIAEYGFESMRSDNPETDGNLLASFSHTFTRLFESREIPARHEARALGLQILNASVDEAPNRNRLEVGIPWDSLAGHFLDRLGLPASRKLTNVLSLAMDVLNDLGISVPTTCERSGVVFRAYRHGEDARCSDAELALAHKTIEGLLAAYKAPGVPKLILEKTLVLLQKIGVAQQFMEPFFGTTGTEGTVRIGFELLGPVAIVSTGSAHRPDRDLWLSDYLLERRVLRHQKNRGYYLGDPIEANFQRCDAPDQAYELGTILGLLLRSGAKVGGAKRMRPPLDGSGLTILAVCWPPRFMAGALHAELDYFVRWWKGEGERLFARVDWNSARSMLDLSLRLTQGQGYVALNQGRFKYLAFRQGTHKRLIRECENFLRRLLDTDLIARRWSIYWRSVDDLVSVNEIKRFRGHIDEAASLIWELRALATTVELVCAANALHLDPRAKGGRQMLLRALGTRSEIASDRRRFKVPLGEEGRQLFKRLGVYARGIEGRARRDPQPRLFESEREREQGESLSKYVVVRMRDIVRQIASLGDEVVPEMAEYGRLSFRRDYKVLVWYDVRDSTGSARRHEVTVDEHRQRVKTFKGQINGRLMRLRQDLDSKQSEIHCWNGDFGSFNDEKHVFLSGSPSSPNSNRVVSELAAAARTAKVQLRIVVVPCGFVDSAVYRLGFGPEVRGARFWEHFSRLRKALRKEEETFPNARTFLAVATPYQVREFSVPRRSTWVGRRTVEIVTEIELLEAKTEVTVGSLTV